MKKFFLLILLIILEPLYAISKESEPVVNIYFFNNGNTYLIYENESPFFTKYVIDHLQNATERKRTLFSNLKSKADDILVFGCGYFQVKGYNEKDEEINYLASFEKFVYNEKDNKAYEYNLCEDIYRYISIKYLHDNYLIQNSEENEFDIQHYWYKE